VMNIQNMSMHFIRVIQNLYCEVLMAKRGRRPLELRNTERKVKLVKRNYYIDEKITKALTVLSALTDKELSFLVNEALCDLIHKYQPKTNINLSELILIQNKG
jgi:hypothetical protein